MSGPRSIAEGVLRAFSVRRGWHLLGVNLILAVAIPVMSLGFSTTDVDPGQVNSVIRVLSVGLLVSVGGLVLASPTIEIELPLRQRLRRAELSLFWLVAAGPSLIMSAVAWLLLGEGDPSTVFRNTVAMVGLVLVLVGLGYRRWAWVGPLCLVLITVVLEGMRRAGDVMAFLLAPTSDIQATVVSVGLFLLGTAALYFEPSRHG